MLMFSPSRKPATSSPLMKAASDPGISALPRTPLTRRGSCVRPMATQDMAPPRNVTKSRRLICHHLVGSRHAGAGSKRNVNILRTGGACDASQIASQVAMMEGKALAFGRLPRHPEVWRLRSLSVYSTVLLGLVVVERAAPRHVRLIRIS